MRHRVSGRSRPQVEYEPLIQLHGAVFVHASRLLARGVQVHLRVFTQIAESHFAFDLKTELCPFSSSSLLFSPQTSRSNRSACTVGGEGGGGGDIEY